jgi:hypothetical protein
LECFSGASRDFSVSEISARIPECLDLQCGYVGSYDCLGVVFYVSEAHLMRVSSSFELLT